MVYRDQAELVFTYLTNQYIAFVSVTVQNANVENSDRLNLCSWEFSAGEVATFAFVFLHYLHRAVFDTISETLG